MNPGSQTLSYLICSNKKTTATEPPPANSPTMHSRLVQQEKPKKTKLKIL